MTVEDHTIKQEFFTAPPKKIQLVRIAHVYYKHKDIERAKEFMDDFGFYAAKQVGERLYYRGYGEEPFVICIEKADKDEFGGAAFVVESEDDLHNAAKILPKETKPSEVYELKDAPGGGKCVTFYDPVDGFPFHLVYGQTPVERMDPHFPEVKINFPTVKERPKNTFRRFEKRPAPVHKLGHFGMCVTNYAKCYEFYSTFFNFYPSELVHNDKGVDVTVFFRLNRGDELVDHHCFFFFEGPRAPHVHHSSFETHDYDTQVLGHDWLRHKGWENCWGVGRHIMGSQIFDYWFDPAGFILEHYVDGDLLDMSEPIHKNPASPDNLHVWGPDLPPTFLT
ncbi:Glyoxalase/Bleomycin resistance protein/Dihydroxybiphenyl dioxygenase [Coniochaeta hoffmannii]|uniref:Glyoxalase/Bleomycin resistance protein/Dihydroxybiphenyl dioxygenase n=1 Tax=Coniochaeta hoffmannii TaxID=91930 RepID=A0AA38RZT6_9PEZI|nr:Glyoxalase/Bleomycin resistance protein/Dihydroxybiphenyl dioxygenase [Coniochaeta hoffmannii]